MPHQLSWWLYLCVCDCTLVQCGQKFLNLSYTLRTKQHAKFCESLQLQRQAKPNFQSNRIFGTDLIPIPVEWSLFNYKTIQMLWCCVPLITIRFWDQIFFSILYYKYTYANALDRLPLYSLQHVWPQQDGELWCILPMLLTCVWMKQYQDKG
jgi:hypothetical protein